MFVTRRGGTEILLLHRSPRQGSYWHVVAGGVEPAESPSEAARRELHEETGLIAEVSGSVEVVEYVYALTEEPAERRSRYDPSVVGVEVTCFSVQAPDDWEPFLDWAHGGHAGVICRQRWRLCGGQQQHKRSDNWSPLRANQHEATSERHNVGAAPGESDWSSKCSAMTPDRQISARSQSDRKVVPISGHAVASRSPNRRLRASSHPFAPIAMRWRAWVAHSMYSRSYRMPHSSASDAQNAMPP